VFEAGGDHVALAGSFDRMYWPGRAAYFGHSPRYRLSLYDARTRKRVGCFDAARFPINAVAFHPSEPVIAVGAGSYDGGYMFEGELVVWDYRSGEVRSLLAESREVAGCHFLRDGRLAVLLRPRHEEDFEGVDAFETFVTCVVDPREAPRRDPDGTDPRLVGLQPVDPRACGFDRVRNAAPPERSRRVAELAASWSGTFEERHRVWDVAWLDDDSLLLALDGCLAERWTADGRRRARHEGRDQGVQIFPGRPAIVHGIRPAEPPYVWRESALWTLDSDSARELKRFDRTLAFSRAADGSLLGRDTDSGRGRGGRGDLVLSRDGKVHRSLDLGGYDCFNHYLRLDGARRHLYLAGRPEEPHLEKRLMACSLDGERQEELWPWDVPPRQLMEGTACLAPGERLIASYRVYHPDPRRAEAFIESRSLADGRTSWRVPVEAAASSMAVALDRSCVIFALMSGRIGALDTGSAVCSGKSRPPSATHRPSSPRWPSAAIAWPPGRSAGEGSSSGSPERPQGSLSALRRGRCRGRRCRARCPRSRRRRCRRS